VPLVFTFPGEEAQKAGHHQQLVPPTLNEGHRCRAARLFALLSLGYHNHSHHQRDFNVV